MVLLLITQSWERGRIGSAQLNRHFVVLRIPSLRFEPWLFFVVFLGPIFDLNLTGLSTNILVGTSNYRGNNKNA